MENKSLRNAGLAWYEGNIVRAQLARTILLLVDPVAAVTLMVEAINRTKKVADREGKSPRWRLSIADDVRWEGIAPVILDTCRELDIPMYGYTKFNSDDRPEIDDVSLVRSASELTSVRDVKSMTSAGETVAVVLDTKRHEELPAKWNGIIVFDGDKHDDRTQEPGGVIVALRAKGDAVGSKSKFVFSAKG